ncbi:hypothetical protein BC831DRAFT_89154 [Entophlyctis helioformis]|nr:hypothetical protein BC831DRAFT_89154 [Entophlyctis helioformis]
MAASTCQLGLQQSIPETVFRFMAEWLPQLISVPAHQSRASSASSNTSGSSSRRTSTMARLSTNDLVQASSTVHGGPSGQHAQSPGATNAHGSPASAFSASFNNPYDIALARQLHAQALQAQAKAHQTHAASRHRTESQSISTLGEHDLSLTTSLIEPTPMPGPASPSAVSSMASVPLGGSPAHDSSESFATALSAVVAAAAAAAAAATATSARAADAAAAADAAECPSTSASPRSMVQAISVAGMHAMGNMAQPRLTLLPASSSAPSAEVPRQSMPISDKTTARAKTLGSSPSPASGWSPHSAASLSASAGSAATSAAALHSLPQSQSQSHSQSHSQTTPMPLDHHHPHQASRQPQSHAPSHAPSLSQFHLHIPQSVSSDWTSAAHHVAAPTAANQPSNLAQSLAALANPAAPAAEPTSYRFMSPPPQPPMPALSSLPQSSSSSCFSAALAPASSSAATPSSPTALTLQSAMISMPVPQHHMFQPSRALHQQQHAQMHHFGNPHAHRDHSQLHQQSQTRAASAQTPSSSGSPMLLNPVRVQPVGLKRKSIESIESVLADAMTFKPNAAPAPMSVPSRPDSAAGRSPTIGYAHGNGNGNDHTDDGMGGGDHRRQYRHAFKAPRLLDDSTVESPTAMHSTPHLPDMGAAAHHTNGFPWQTASRDQPHQPHHACSLLGGGDPSQQAQEHAADHDPITDVIKLVREWRQQEAAFQRRMLSLLETILDSRQEGRRSHGSHGSHWQRSGSGSGSGGDADGSGSGPAAGGMVGTTI